MAKKMYIRCPCCETLHEDPKPDGCPRIDCGKNLVKSSREKGEDVVYVSL